MDKIQAYLSSFEKNVSCSRWNKASDVPSFDNSSLDSCKKQMSCASYAAFAKKKANQNVEVVSDSFTIKNDAAGVPEIDALCYLANLANLANHGKGLDVEDRNKNLYNLVGCLAKKKKPFFSSPPSSPKLNMDAPPKAKLGDAVQPKGECFKEMCAFYSEHSAALGCPKPKSSS